MDSSLEGLMQEPSSSLSSPFPVAPAAAAPAAAAAAPAGTNMWDACANAIDRPQSRGEGERTLGAIDSDNPFGLTRMSSSQGDGTSDPWSANLSHRLDAVCLQLKGGVEHEFKLALQNLQGNHNNLMDAQRMRHEATHRQQMMAIEALEREKQALWKRCGGNEQRFQGTLNMMDKARTAFGGRMSMAAIFKNWAALARGLDDFMHDKLSDHVLSARLKRKYFAIYRHWAHTGSREKLLAHERAKHEMVHAKVFEQMQAEREAMAAEIELLKRKLEEESSQRRLLQDNLKRVFMRGVCALNFEAMSLLSDGGVSEQPLSNSLSFSSSPAGLPGATFDGGAAAAAPPNHMGSDLPPQQIAAYPRQIPQLATIEHDRERPQLGFLPPASNDCADAACYGMRPAYAQAEQPSQAAESMAPIQQLPPSPDKARLPPAPLPFVTYTGPPAESSGATGGGGVPRSGAPVPAASSKFSRWQPAPAPRAAAAMG